MSDAAPWLADTHCHLPMLEHKPLAQVLEDADAVGVRTLVCIGAAQGYDSAAKAVDLAEQFPGIWASVGIHPHDTKDCLSISKLEKFVEHPKVVGIGETGLDYYRDWAPRENQLKVFVDTIAFAKSCGKPLIIHSREAGGEVYKLLKLHKAELVGGVFHAYSEDDEFARKLIDINFKLSFGGPITFKKAEEFRSIVERIPLSQIMLETDCPFMAPEPYRGKPSEPAHVRIIAEKLAEVKGLSLDEVAKITTETAASFFKLPALA